ncbi:tetratricopeptide repeat protein [Streptomyces murinus]|uniref:tetratricopeptide repeat protein n=1 Tax=Streptomyces murinus TaxID=33900 RepID=UPI002E816521|nr:tetratricopeptide repeat protein [Streptomyces murinus]WUD09296.1 tetratricopeptide repeat protein [Streptomyces murinus]
MNTAAGRFWKQVRHVYEAAESPALSRLEALARDLGLPRKADGPPSRPAVVRPGRPTQYAAGKSAISAWLNGESVPAPNRDAHFLAVIRFLEGRAQHKSGHRALRPGVWQRLLAEARAEREASRGGRTAARRETDIQGPVNLPPPPPGFTGREAEAERILSWLGPVPDNASEEEGGPPSAVCVVSGMGGVGKTALILHAARRARLAFPGGVIFADLHGYMADHEVEATALVDRLLRMVGVGDKDLPPTAEGKRDAWRLALNDLAEEGRPLLVVLDNVRKVTQIAGLLPTSPHRMLITSRHTLATLLARRIELDPLSADEAVRLLDRALREGDTDDDRVTAQPSDARNLAELCGSLPLSLRIIAALLRDEPARPLSGQVKELVDARTRLDALQHEDTDEHGSPLAVRASFDLSYRHLNGRQKRAFRLLAAAPGPDISTEAATALLEEGTARRLLADLARAHLLQSASADRWSLHDLLRLYGEELGREHLGDDRRDAAMDRLLDHYLTLAWAADARMAGSEDTAISARFLGQEQALAWLDAERATVVAAAVSPAARGHAAATELATALTRYCIECRHFDELNLLTGAAAEVLGERGDRAGQAVALNNLGNGLRSVRRFDDAVTAHESAVALWQDLGDPYGEATGTTNLGRVLLDLRRYQESVDAQTRATGAFRKLGDRRGEAAALDNLGSALVACGRFREAIDAHSAAFELCRETGDQYGMASGMGLLGHALDRAHRYEEAARFYSSAVHLYRALGDRRREATELGGLGDALRKSGRHDEAFAAYTAGLNRCREIGDRLGEAEALNRLGHASMAVRRTDEAVDTHMAAIAINRELGDLHAENASLSGAGHVLTDAHRFEQAVDVYERQVAVCRELGDRRCEADAWGNLGLALQAAGRSQEAIDAQATCIAVHRELGDGHGEVMGLNGLGITLEEAGRFDEAIDVRTRAIHLSRTLGIRRDEGLALDGLGSAFTRSGRCDEAIDAHTAAVEIFRALNDLQCEAMALHGLGGALQAAGRYKEAVDAHARDVEICQEQGEQQLEAMALVSLGETLVKVCRLQEAVDAYRAAASLFRALGDRSGESGAMSGLRHAQEAVAASANGGDTPTPPL